MIGGEWCVSYLLVARRKLGEGEIDRGDGYVFGCGVNEGDLSHEGVFRAAEQLCGRHAVSIQEFEKGVGTLAKRTHLDDPYRCFLFAAHESFSADDPSDGVDSAVNRVDADDVGTF